MEGLYLGPLGWFPRPEHFDSVWPFSNSLSAHYLRWQGSRPSLYKQLLREEKQTGWTSYLLFVSVGPERITKWKSWGSVWALTQTHTKQPRDIFTKEGITQHRVITTRDFPSLLCDHLLPHISLSAPKCLFSRHTHKWIKKKIWVVFNT